MLRLKGPTSNVTGVARNQDIEFTFNQVMDSSTINDTTFTVMQGSTNVAGILSKTGITFQTGASMNGRVLAQTAVILDGNALSNP